MITAAVETFASVLLTKFYVSLVVADNYIQGWLSLAKTLFFGSKTAKSQCYNV